MEHAQNSLAWVLAQKLWIVPIPGTTKLHPMEKNVGVVDVILTENKLSLLIQKLDEFVVAGERYTPVLIWQREPEYKRIRCRHI